MKNIESHVSVEEKEKPNERWKKYTVGVMSASSEANIPARANGRFIGGLIAESGFNARNGGYSAGAMREMADGFREKCRAEGIGDEEIAEHLSGVVFSDKAIGEGLRKKRKLNETATISDEGNDWWSRSGGIVNKSDAIIVLEGGIGTNNEGTGSAMGEWFAQQKNEQLIRDMEEAEKRGELTPELQKLKLSERVPIKPIISLDSTQTFSDSLRLIESRSPGTVGTVTKHIYILTGHSRPSARSGEGMYGILDTESFDAEMGDDPKKFKALDVFGDATAENDPKVAEQLKALLRYYYLMNVEVLEKREKTLEEKDEMEDLRHNLLDTDGPLKVLTLKEDWKRRRTYSGGEGI